MIKGGAFRVAYRRSHGWEGMRIKLPYTNKNILTIIFLQPLLVLKMLPVERSIAIQIIIVILEKPRVLQARITHTNKQTYTHTKLQ